MTRAGRSREGRALLGRAGLRALDRDECHRGGIAPRAGLPGCSPSTRRARGAAHRISAARFVRTGALDAADAASPRRSREAARRRADGAPSGDRARRLAFMRDRRTRRHSATRTASDRRLRADRQRRHLADAWQLMAIAELAARDRARSSGAPSGREYAVASGDTRRQIEAWNEVGGAMLFGRTPVEEALAFLDEELAWARERGLGAVEADALLGGPYLDARLGRFDVARDKLERSKAICRELGIAYGLVEAHIAGAQMEELAGDLDAAERELREAIRVATEMGAGRYVAIHRTRLARVPSPGAATTTPPPSSSCAGRLRRRRPWKARARVLARRGADRGSGRARARGGRRPTVSDDITAQADVLVDLAEVLRARGDLEGPPMRLRRPLRSTRRRATCCPPTGVERFWPPSA